MAIKEIFKKARKAFSPKKTTASGSTATAADTPQAEKVLVKHQNSSQNSARSLEMIQNGLSDLVTQLDNINNNLSKQSDQNQQLMDRIEHLPDMIHTLPEAVKNQSATVKALLKKIEDNQNKELEFIRAVESIPRETGKQTDQLEKISGQLASSAEVDVQFSESFNNFKDSLVKFDKTTQQQNDTLDQINKTFETSDRYMKYLVEKQAKNFKWLFIISMSVCLVSIIALISVLAYFISRS